MTSISLPSRSTRILRLPARNQLRANTSRARCSTNPAWQRHAPSTKCTMSSSLINAEFCYEQNKKAEELEEGRDQRACGAAGRNLVRASWLVQACEPAER